MVMGRTHRIRINPWFGMVREEETDIEWIGLILFVDGF